MYIFHSSGHIRTYIYVYIYTYLYIYILCINIDININIIYILYILYVYIYILYMYYICICEYICIYIPVHRTRRWRKFQWYETMGEVSCCMYSRVNLPMDQKVVGVVFLDGLQWSPHPQLLDIVVVQCSAVYCSVA